MKDLPIGIQTFQDLIEGNFLYIDKTEYVYQMVRPAKGVYFLSRPRRFGKSLLLSTLEAIFKGKKELFKELWIYDQLFEWKNYPIIRIDFSKKYIENSAELKEFIKIELQDIAEDYNIALAREHYDDIFAELIRKLSQLGKVVVLIDEYDKPILDNITDVETAKEIQETLKGFYTVLKASDEYLKFIFLTGVSKFSKVGVFSGLNNLNDITMNENYCELLGYTAEELITYFPDRIKQLEDKFGKKESDVLVDIKKWYNGYRFSIKSSYVYNPFSTLLLFDNMEYKNYWFESGTPTFLIDLIKNKEMGIVDLNHMVTKEDSFSSYEVDNLEPEPLLFQTGYITIKDYDPLTREYVLAYPNTEVAESFEKWLLSAYSTLSKTAVNGHLSKLMLCLKMCDLDEFFEIMKIFFATIPYTIQLKAEKYYQSIFYLIFILMGFQIEVEVTTNRGRIDAVVTLTNTIYVFEFKLNGTKEQAMQQIKANDYAHKYQGTHQKIILVGVEFDKERRNIGQWIMDLLPSPSSVSG